MNWRLASRQRRVERALQLRAAGFSYRLIAVALRCGVETARRYVLRGCPGEPPAAGELPAELPANLAEPSAEPSADQTAPSADQTAPSAELLTDGAPAELPADLGEPSERLRS